MERLEERVLLSMFTVTETLDNAKTGSLRWAINQVNADAARGVDTIDFNIRGAGHSSSRRRRRCRRSPIRS
jgi:hypothetical protein